MTFENRFIHVGSLFESELIQILLFEAGASWVHDGQNIASVFNICIGIDKNLKMSVWATEPLPSVYKELTLLELASGETSMETETLHICEVVDNHIGFQKSEVNLNPDELFVLLRVIRSLPDRDFEITTRDDEELENGELLPISNLTINFK